MYEHEGYRMILAAGLADVPTHVFLPCGTAVTAETLAAVPSRRIALKIVSPDIAHKTEFGGVVFVDNDLDAVRTQVRRLEQAAELASLRAAGTLLCEYVEPDSDALGHELFVGMRFSREFGPIVTAGLGGTATEALADALKPGQAVATAGAKLCTPHQFLETFKRTLAYRMISGQVRGRQRAISDAALLRCFAGMFTLALEASETDGPDLEVLQEFEINPLRVARGRLVALDAAGRRGAPVHPRLPRPIGKIAHLLKPQSIALAGVSSRSMNLARIILANLRKGGFDPARLFVVKPGEQRIDGTACVASFAELPEKVDLAVIAVGAGQIAQCVREIIATDAAQSVIIIPGGMGETAAGTAIEKALATEIAASHRLPSGGPVFLGGNCMGVQSRPGRYDTFFIPADKWDARLDAPPRRLAFVSQSGAFLISRLSNVGCLDPAYAVTVGNQIDLTVSDVLEFLADDADIDTYAVYVEGLLDLDGLRLAGVVRKIVGRGKTVVAYRAGRTAAGRSATAGHTSVLAGDYAVCAAVLSDAGALVAESFREFEQLVELSTALHGRRIGEGRLGVITNAGFEAVGMADSLSGPGDQLSMGTLSAEAISALREILSEARLDAIVNATNPLDLTPMAGEEVYERSARLMLDDAGIDALVVSMVPLTPMLHTTPAELGAGDTIVNRLAGLSRASPKPMIVVIDAGPAYDPLATQMRRQGLAVFRSADEAVGSLGRYAKTCPVLGRISHCWESRICDPGST